MPQSNTQYKSNKTAHKPCRCEISNPTHRVCWLISTTWNRFFENYLFFFVAKCVRCGHPLFYACEHYSRSFSHVFFWPERPKNCWWWLLGEWSAYITLDHHLCSNLSQIWNPPSEQNLTAHNHANTGNSDPDSWPQFCTLIWLAPRETVNSR